MYKALSDQKCEKLDYLIYVTTSKTTSVFYHNRNEDNQRKKNELKLSRR